MTTHAHRRSILLTLVMLLLLSGVGSVSAARQDDGTPVAGAGTPIATPGLSGRDPSDLAWASEAVCYEIFVRSFVDSTGDGTGDLVGLIERLDYLNDGDPETTDDLGVNCIWLMPISTATSYHSYDVEDYYTVDPDYGTNEDFQRFMTEANARGIRVIIDLVLNHTSINHPWFQDAVTNPDSPYRDWYIFEEEDPGYRGPWGERAWHASPAGDGTYYYGVFWSGMPDLNYRNPEVTAEALRISEFWLEEMGVDGFRLDAIKHLIEDGPIQENTPETHQWLRDYSAWMRENYPDAITIGEIFGATTVTLDGYLPDQLDTYFHFEIGARIIEAASGGAGTTLRVILNDAVTKIPAQRFAPFLTNHDQQRVMTTLGDDTAKMKLGAFTLLTIPGTPFLYYGEEIGVTGRKPDEDLRTPMQWTADPETAGFTEGTPWRAPQPNTPTVNVADQTDDPDSLLTYYRDLIQLRMEHPALNIGDFVALRSSDLAVMAYVRTDPATDDMLLVMINFGTDPVAEPLLRVDASDLPEGEHTGEFLFGGDDLGVFGGLTIGAGGEIEEQAVLSELPGQTGIIVRLGRARG